MKLGFMTAPLPESPLMEVADWAAGNGFECLEIACWSRTGARRGGTCEDPRLRRGKATITAEAATFKEAGLLGIREGDPLIVERRVIVDSHGRPVEATESRYPGDRYALDVRLDVEARAADAA